MRNLQKRRSFSVVMTKQVPAVSRCVSIRSSVIFVKTFNFLHDDSCSRVYLINYTCYLSAPLGESLKDSCLGIALIPIAGPLNRILTGFFQEEQQKNKNKNKNETKNLCNLCKTTHTHTHTHTHTQKCIFTASPDLTKQHSQLKKLLLNFPDYLI